MKKTAYPLTQAEYVACAGMMCPFCGSQEIDGLHFDPHDSLVIETVVCCRCNKEWDIVYKLDGYQAR